MDVGVDGDVGFGCDTLPRWASPVLRPTTTTTMVSVLSTMPCPGKLGYDAPDDDGDDVFRRRIGVKDVGVDGAVVFGCVALPRWASPVMRPTTTTMVSVLSIFTS